MAVPGELAIVPARHFEQFIRDTAPPEARNFPVSQSMQSLASSDPRTSTYLPGIQSSHCIVGAVLNLPSWHKEHDEAPTRFNVFVTEPGLQTTQEVLLAASVYVPAAHGTQLETPGLTPIYPAGHSRHSSVVIEPSTVPYFPRLQRMH